MIEGKVSHKDLEKAAFRASQKTIKTDKNFYKIRENINEDSNHTINEDSKEAYVSKKYFNASQEKQKPPLKP